MKKAKEYALEFISAYEKNIRFDLISTPKEKAFNYVKQTTRLFQDLFIVEVKQLIDLRNIKTDFGVINIYKEQWKKINSIIKHVGNEQILSLSDFHNFLNVMYKDDNLGLKIISYSYL